VKRIEEKKEKEEVKEEEFHIHFFFLHRCTSSSPDTNEHSLNSAKLVPIAYDPLMTP